jgi:acetyltransferase-like isoleucine patch superfamily enzyme
MNQVSVGPNTVVASNVTFSGTARIGANCILGDEAGPPLVVGDGCEIGHFVTVHGGVSLGKRVRVESHAVIGYDNLTRIWDPELVAEVTWLGDDVLVRSHTVVYRGCTLGEQAKVGHSVVLREGTHLGERSVIGCLVKSEGYTRIGARCVIHAQTHVTSFMTVEDYVFFGPQCVTMNDPDAAHYRQRRRSIRGPVVRRGARIGSGAMLCPGVEVGEEAFIGAGAVVVQAVPGREVWGGNPAKKLRDVNERERLMPTEGDFVRSLKKQ